MFKILKFYSLFMEFIMISMYVFLVSFFTFSPHIVSFFGSKSFISHILGFYALFF